MIWAWRLTSRAVVGSSAMSRAGRQAMAWAMVTRWRRPPLSWWGYSRARRRGVRDADFVHGFDGPVPGGRAAEPFVKPQPLGDLFADGVHGIKCRQRVLKDHRRVLAADGAHLALAEAGQVAAAQGNGVGLDPGLRRREAQQGQGDAGLAAAALADQGQRAALVQRERGVVHGGEGLPAHREANREILDVQ